MSSNKIISTPMGLLLSDSEDSKRASAERNDPDNNIKMQKVFRRHAHKKEDWDERYLTGDTPWDTGRPDFNLREVVVKRRISPCKTLEVGCGTGTNAIWLAQKAFSVTAVDITGRAIETAIKKASQAKVRCKFYAVDFMKQSIAGAPFGFVFDRGCFHSFDLARERTKFAKITHSCLKKDGLWLTLVGSTDGPQYEPGPPRRSARDIITAVEPYFQILSLYASHFDSVMEKPPRIWVCLMQRRGRAL